MGLDYAKKRQKIASGGLIVTTKRLENRRLKYIRLRLAEPNKYMAEQIYNKDKPKQMVYTVGKKAYLTRIWSKKTPIFLGRFIDIKYG